MSPKRATQSTQPGNPPAQHSDTGSAQLQLTRDSSLAQTGLVVNRGQDLRNPPLESHTLQGHTTRPGAKRPHFALITHPVLRDSLEHSPLDTGNLSGSRGPETTSQTLEAWSQTLQPNSGLCVSDFTPHLKFPIRRGEAGLKGS